jgi:hypothetical protein
MPKPKMTLPAKSTNVTIYSTTPSTSILDSPFIEGFGGKL